MRHMRNTFLCALVVTLAACGGQTRREMIQNKGSDTLVNVAQAWAEEYKNVDPAVAIAVSGGGSGTGISALINGQVDIANASRTMKQSEIEAAKAKNGVAPKEYVVGFDALVVYVHKDNPIEKITIAQLAGIYGENGEITKWSQLGVTVPGEHDEILRFSRQNNSGTYEYFKGAVLGGEKGRYKLGSKDLHGSKDVVEAVGHAPSGIGYSGLAYATDAVKAVPVAKDEASPAVVPTVDTAVDGSYPIARPLIMYTSGEPKGTVKAYLDWIMSDAGQRIIQDKGYAPVRALD